MLADSQISSALQAGLRQLVNDISRDGQNLPAWNDRPMHDAQRSIFESEVRFVVAACGRRFGKTEGSRRYLISNAQQGYYGWWISPTYKMAVDVWREMVADTRDIRQDINKSDHEITFPSGGRLRVLSGHEPDRLRGSGLDTVIIDEAAFCAEYVWHVIRPALSDRQGRAFFLSTPNGRNWFYRLWQRGNDPLETDWQSFKNPTWANPHIVPSEIEAARRELPELMFQQEYEAEFLEDFGTVFRGVSEVSKGKPQEPIAGHSYVFGVDWGKYKDYTAISVLDETTRQEVFLDRFNQIGWQLQRGRLTNLYNTYKPRLIMAELNSIGDPNVEELHSAGLPVQGFTMTNASKNELVNGMALDIEQRGIGLLDDPVATAEMMDYEMKRLPSGLWVYNAPEGGHDDTVVARMLGRHAANTRAAVITVQRGDSKLNERGW